MLDDSVKKKKKENEKIEIRRETRLGTRRKKIDSLPRETV